MGMAKCKCGSYEFKLNEDEVKDTINTIAYCRVCGEKYNTYRSIKELALELFNLG